MNTYQTRAVKMTSTSSNSEKKMKTSMPHFIQRHTEFKNCKRFAKLVLCTFFALSNPSFAQQELSDFSVLPENLTGNITSNPNVLIIIDNSSSMADFFLTDGQDQGTPDDDNDGFYITDPRTGVAYRDRIAEGDDDNERVAEYSDASSSFSNSYRVREAILNVLNSPIYENRINVGVAAFGQNRCTYDSTDNPSQEGSGADRGGRNRDQNTGFRVDVACTSLNAAGNAVFAARGTTGLGQIRANIAPLTGPHKDTLLDLLALEPTIWSDSNPDNIAFDGGGRDFVRLPANDRLPVNGKTHPFLNTTSPSTVGVLDGSESTIITMPPGDRSNFTPLAGSLDTAFRFMLRNDTRVDSVPGLDQKFKDGIVTRENGVSGDLSYLTESQCTGPLSVILLTDGVPTQTVPSDLNVGIGLNDSGDASDQAPVASQRLRYRGYANEAAALAAGLTQSDFIDVHVIGFNLTNVNAANAIANSGGTNRAINTSSSDDVERAFSTIFDDLLTQGASRSGLSVITSPDSATGSFVQPSFTPLRTFTNTANQTIQEVTWSGELRNFFIDAFGNFREDSNGDNELDPSDLGFRILATEIDGNNQTYVERFNVANSGAESNLTGDLIEDSSGNPTGRFNGGLIEVEDLRPIWNASDNFDALSDNANDIRLNRGYSDAVPSSPNQRFIFTQIDNTIRNFVWSNSASTTTQIGPSQRGYFDIPATAGASETTRNESARDLINYIRGSEFNDKRNRTLNGRKLLLGDIIHSTPVQVAEPPATSSRNSPVTTPALSATYEAYAAHYADRRRMIYVGANDGMLHGFNGGFWDITTPSIIGSTGLPDGPGQIQVRRQRPGSSDTNHRLGDEVWAYIPQAVLPHLKFLADTAYLPDTHVSYVDGSTDAYEVKLFDDRTALTCRNIAADAVAPANCEYVNGWGTILVVGLRFGGADYTADFNGDGNLQTSTSSYLVFDVTNPERPPRLMAEVTDPDLNLTTAKPALVRTPGASATEVKYKLVFGSGPNVLASATNTSGTAPSLFNFDLQDNSLSKTTVTGAEATAFVGDLTSVDWNSDDIDDAVYFGSVSGTVAQPSGKLFRGVPSDDGSTISTSVLLNTDQPIQFEPVVPEDLTDDLNNNYIIFGTGRVFVTTDTSQTYSPRNYLYGIVEQFSSPLSAGAVSFESGPLAFNQILDTTNVNLTATGIDDVVLAGNTREELLDEFDSSGGATPSYIGWRFQLPATTSRLSARPALLQELAFFTDFQPQDPDTLTDTQCLPNGAGFLTVIDFRNGIFPSAGRVNIEEASSNTGDSTDNLVNIRVSSSLLSAGEILIIGESDSGEVNFKFLAPGSNQEVTEFEGKLLPGVVPPPPTFDTGRKSWREVQL